MQPDALDFARYHGEQTGSGSASLTRSQIRGSSLLLIGNIISLTITFLPHILLARYLTTEVYGHLAYGLSLVAIGKTYSLGFNEAMSRFVPIYCSKNEPSKALGSIIVVFAISLSISVLFVTVFFAASRPILQLLTHGHAPAGLLLILIMLVPFETLEILIMNLFACFGHARIIFWGRHVIAPGLRVIAIGLVVLKHYAVPVLAVGYVLCQLVTVLPFGILLLRELKRQNLSRTWSKITFPVREIVSFSGPLMASNMVGLLGNSMPVLLLGYFHPMSTVAIFRIVLPAAALSGMIQANFTPLFMPSASRLFAQGDVRGMNHLFWQTALWMGLLAFPIFLATSCFARPITVLLYGHRYAPSAPVMAILSLSQFVFAIFGFNAVMLKVMGKIRVLVILNLVIPAITLIFNLMLIPQYGAIGAAIATSAGLILQCFARQIAVRRGGINFFEARTTPFFVVLAFGTAIAYLMRLIAPSNVYLAIVTVPAVSLLVLWLVKNQLKVTETFPEIIRLPLLGRLFAKDYAGARAA